MAYKLTFVHKNNDLDINAVQTSLAPFKIMIGDVVWLSDNKAAQIETDKNLNIDDIKKIRGHLKIYSTDVFYTPAQNQRKKVFLADMDSTIVTSETLDELAGEAGIKDQISEITTRAMRGDLDFFDAIRERVGLLKGLPTSALQRTLDDTQISKGADILTKTLKGHDVFCALVSGGFTYFTKGIARQLGFDVHHGNILGIDDEKLTGEVIDPILDKETKLKFLKQYATQQNVTLGDCITIGDGANDLPMLEAAQNAGGLGIGYHPKPLLQDALINCIIHTDLTSVLYAQGYKKKEFSI